MCLFVGKDSVKGFCRPSICFFVFQCLFLSISFFLQISDYSLPLPHNSLKEPEWWAFGQRVAKHPWFCCYQAVRPFKLRITDTAFNLLALSQAYTISSIKPSQAPLLPQASLWSKCLIHLFQLWSFVLPCVGFGWRTFASDPTWSRAPFLIPLSRVYAAWFCSFTPPRFTGNYQPYLFKAKPRSFSMFLLEEVMVSFWMCMSFWMRAS